jgi:hypothetical protein
MQRVVQLSVTLILLGVFLVAGVVHLFLADRESVSCPAGDEWTLAYGGWLEPSFCRTSLGSTTSPEHDDLNLLRPWVSATGLAIVGVAVAVGIVLVWRRPTSRRHIRYEPERSVTLPG